MFRYKLTIEYDGTLFSGWQFQKNQISVQETLEKAIQSCTQEYVRVHVAGRTDAGVHALGQVVHCDLSKKWDTYRLVMALNFYLREKKVVILSAESVSAQFHARFSAFARSYCYRVLNRIAPPACLYGKVWHVPTFLDCKAMQEAAQKLIGFHDFSTFRAQGCQSKSPMKHMTNIEILRENEEIKFYFEAPSFLYHQIRNIVGSLVLVGKGYWSCADFERAFQAKSRAAGGPTAPPQGLYFMKVFY